MREEINYQNDLLARCLKTPYNVSLELQNYDEIWLTGSGDSHCASLFGAALGSILGLPLKALTPMNASHFMNYDVKKRILLKLKSFLL